MLCFSFFALSRNHCFLSATPAACSTESFSLLSWSFQESSILKNKGTWHFLCKEPVAKPLAGTGSLLGRTAWDKLCHSPVCIPEAQPGRAGHPVRRLNSHHLPLLGLFLNGKRISPHLLVPVYPAPHCLWATEESLSVFCPTHTREGWHWSGRNA